MRCVEEEPIIPPPSSSGAVSGSIWLAYDLKLPPLDCDRERDDPVARWAGEKQRQKCELHGLCAFATGDGGRSGDTGPARPRDTTNPTGPGRRRGG